MASSRLRNTGAANCDASHATLSGTAEMIRPPCACQSAAVSDGDWLASCCSQCLLGEKARLA